MLSHSGLKWKQKKTANQISDGNKVQCPFYFSSSGCMLSCLEFLPQRCLERVDRRREDQSSLSWGLPWLEVPLKPTTEQHHNTTTSTNWDIGVTQNMSSLDQTGQSVTLYFFQSIFNIFPSMFSRFLNKQISQVLLNVIRLSLILVELKKKKKGETLKEDDDLFFFSPRMERKTPWR